MLSTPAAHAGLQVDVFIDETFSFDPLNYDAAAFLKEYGLSEEQVQDQPWYRNKRVGAPLCILIFYSSSNVGCGVSGVCH